MDCPERLGTASAVAPELRSKDTGHHRPIGSLPNFTGGPACQAGPIPLPTIDGAMYLAAEVVFAEVWPASPDGIFKELWEINGPFEDPWCAEYNRSVWGDNDTWRNDATGHSYDETIDGS